MAKKSDSYLPQIGEIILALGIILSFFLPWVHSLGNSIAGYEIRKFLEAPHKLFSIFSSNNKFSQDYYLSHWLFLLPLFAGIILFLIWIKAYRNWMGILIGCGAIFVYHFLKHEIQGLPFHHLGKGASWTLKLGWAWIGLSGVKILVSKLFG